MTTTSASASASARQADGGRPRRALVFAGGGLKVAYQAGAVQVLLDEAQIDFDLADGASGGVFNLAMWCQGMTGRQIADNWRSYRPLGGFSPNLGAWLRGPWAASALTDSGLRRRGLTGFGLDWHAIRSTQREAVFELFNVSRQELQSVPAAEITEDRLLSAVALPMWFPPARIDGDTYIDAVFATDGNLEEMIRRGASELWVIWTVSTRGRWAPGFVAEYFLMIEAAANSRLRLALQRIEQNNADIAAGRDGAFGRPITVRLISAEVPMGYLLNIRRKTIQRAVELGVRDTRAWCARHGIPVRPVPPRPAAAPAAIPETVRFHEVMKGRLTVGTEPEGTSARMILDLNVEIRDVGRFLADPGHVAAVSGTVRCAALGGRLRIRSGTLRLLTDARSTEGTEKNMTYELEVTDRDGRTRRVHGVKRLVRGARPQIWADSTSLTTEVRDEPTGHVLAAGILRISAGGFLRQLTTFRATAPTARGRIGALAQFGDFFVDQLWQVYVRPVRPMPPQPWLANGTRRAPQTARPGRLPRGELPCGPRRGGGPAVLGRVRQRADQLGAGPDAQFAVRAGQVILDGLGGQEQLHGRLGVGRTVGDHQRDPQLLGSELLLAVQAVRPGGHSGRAQLAARPGRPWLGAEPLEHGQRVLQLGPGVGPPAAPAQQFAVLQPGPRLLKRLRRPRMPAERLREGVVGGLFVFGEQGPAARRDRGFGGPTGPGRLRAHQVADGAGAARLAGPVECFGQVPAQFSRTASPSA